uniref:Uncharacterized LOC103030285 n=1 Tax=Astyanax mexicanus TaxID=7994 RepID=A0A8B9HRT8_ASTMX
MVAAAPQHPADLGPQAQSIHSGPPPVRGPRPPMPGSFRGPHLERQQQPNWPFFYVQPSQPYQPYQWPMPMPYVPYGGFPGMGYGMIVPPLPPPAPYMDAPGYILPHAQLHMVDYRRMMAPHLAPSMAYQARRFRFQHTTPSGRVMVSSEVQTEPVYSESPHHVCKGSASSQTSSESGRDICSNFSSPEPHEERPLEEAFEIPSNKPLADKVAAASNGSSVVSNGEILFQAEEVRIECRGTPAECDEYLPACPDILMMGACPSSSTLEGTDGTQVDPVNSTAAHSLVLKGEDDVCENSKNVQCKIMRLPFDLQCLDQLRQMEASVWSVESLLPYVPSAEWMIQNGLLTPQKPPLTPVMEVPAESLPELPQEANQTPTDTESAPQEILRGERVIELDRQDSLTSLESLPPYLPAASWLADLGHVYYSKLQSDVQQEPGNLKAWPEGRLGEKTEVCEESKIQSSSVSLKSGSVHFKEETVAPKGKTSGHDLSDQDSCPVPPRSGKPCSAKRKARICKSCLLKWKGDNISGSPSPPKANCTKHHHTSHSRLSGDKSKPHLCVLCLSDPEKAAKCKANAAVPGLIDDETEGEVSENSLNPSGGSKKRSVEAQKRLYNNSQKVLSGRHSEKCPMSHQSKLREQNCSCDDPKGLPNSSPPWNSNNGHGRHHGATQEKNEENVAVCATERWRDSEQRFISQKQKERSWRGSVQGSDTESIKIMRPHNKPKQHAPAQDIHRRDTRC